jgi:trans-aconitate 2-methyltransferase
VAAPLATLVIHETERLESNHPALRRYYELVEEMQRHYGQKLNVGATLDGNFAGTGWRVQQSRSFSCGKVRAGYGSATLANLLTWDKKRICCSGIRSSRAGLTGGAALDSIASGASEGGMVRNTVKHIVAKCP